MAVRLSGKQPWLTRMNAMLRGTLKKHAVSNHDGSSEEDFNPHFLRRLRQKRHELEINMANLQQALDNYIEAADELQPPLDGNQMAEIEQNIDSAQATHLKGQNRLTEPCSILEQNADVPMSSSVSEETVKPRLAPPHIRKFDGRLWQREHFWRVFDAVVHKIEKLSYLLEAEKLSYLLEVLEGPAKDTVSKLQVTADNYDVAIQLLMEKYDNQEAVVNHLLQELQDIQPASTTITDQVNALDKILAIISQLERKGERPFKD
ncbi:unnamed protein product [Haemonchus placei]|uniref:Dynactin subunit 2 n=1 Tax=Haemonchus placei TaxID=6290 RepID=A0A0N4W128_HAEPC|nr:unnamed protein product [Haemonchus placei]